jgi:hypothetical protein
MRLPLDELTEFGSRLLVDVAASYVARAAAHADDHLLGARAPVIRRAMRSSDRCVDERRTYDHRRAPLIVGAKPVHRTGQNVDESAAAEHETA